MFIYRYNTSTLFCQQRQIHILIEKLSQVILLNTLKKYPILTGTLLLSGSGLFCRGLGFFYRLFISRSFGEEAMGIFQLVSPIIMMAYSLTCAGIQTSISRFVASAYQKKNNYQCQRYLLAGVFFASLISLIYSALIYGQAEFISLFLLKEPRCIPLLKIIAFSFPISTLHCCLNGYYYGKKEAFLPSFTQILEQLVRTGSVMILYYYLLYFGKQPTIALTCMGMLLGEAFSFMVTLFFYLKNDYIKKQNVSARPSLLPMISFSIPLTFNRVMVNILRSLETISLPQALRLFGYSSSASLSIYGVFTGMVLSLVLFPSTFTNSAAVLLLPTISEALTDNNRKKIKATLYKTFIISLLPGIFFGLLFFLLGQFLGNLLFQSMLAGMLIQRIAFLCPFLYLHTTLSSILNGLKKTGHTLFIDISSLLLRLFFIMKAVPLYGIEGYLIALIVCEIYCSLLSLYFLRKYF